MEKEVIPLGCVAEVAIDVKEEKFNENFINTSDLLILTKLIELKLKNNGFAICFNKYLSDCHFSVGLPIVMKKDDFVWESEIKDESVKKVVYDKEYIYYCLLWIMYNKIYSSINHNCLTCTAKTTGECLNRWQIHSLNVANDCDRWSSSIFSECDDNLSKDELALIAKMQKDSSELNGIKHLAYINKMIQKDFSEDE